jgi:excinuclease ABC subunit A
VIVIEHNLDVINLADWVIDLGPGGGRDGGQVVFSGKREDMEECAQSVTGLALKRWRGAVASGV